MLSTFNNVLLCVLQAKSLKPLEVLNQFLVFETRDAIKICEAVANTT